MGANAPYTREAGRHPIAFALNEAGVVRVGRRVFCVLDGRGQPDAPLANSHITVYKLPTRRIRAHRNVNCPNASGACTNHPLNPQYMPPALRKSALGKVLGFVPQRG